MDNLSVGQALFVGQGIGGSMVFRLAVERPDLVAGFISVEAGAAEEAMSPGFKNVLRLAKAVVKLGGKDLLRTATSRSWKRVPATPAGSTDGP